MERAVGRRKSPKFHHITQIWLDKFKAEGTAGKRFTPVQGTFTNKPAKCISCGDGAHPNIRISHCTAGDNSTAGEVTRLGVQPGRSHQVS